MSVAPRSHVFGGHVDPGYEPVRELFLRHFADGLEDCAQCCVFVRGRPVVDLWGARADDSGEPRHNYGPGTMQNVFSSSKVLTSLVVAMLADRGHLSYSQLVCEIWPEYAQHGKGSTTVAQVMRHEAGIPALDAPLDVSDLTAEGLRGGAVGDAIARQRPRHEPGHTRQYHALTRGWIVNEIVRRADPAGRTIGEFLREEVAEPLGLDGELAVGLPDELHDSVAPLTSRSARWVVSQLAQPRGGKLAGISTVPARLGVLVALPTLYVGNALNISRGPLVVNGKKPDSFLQAWNLPEFRRAEIPSANGHASARALAKIAALVVEGGALPGGPRLLSPEGLDEALGDPVLKVLFYALKTRFTNAGWNLFGSTRMGFVGWMGLGGSTMQWHPELRIGFGYAMNCIEVNPWNVRALKLQWEAVRCAKQHDVPPRPTLSVRYEAPQTSKL